MSGCGGVGVSQARGTSRGLGEGRGGEAGDFSDSQPLLRLSWLGWEEDTTPPGSGEENEAHEEGGFLYTIF